MLGGSSIYSAVVRCIITCSTCTVFMRWKLPDACTNNKGQDLLYYLCVLAAVHYLIINTYYIIIYR
jgi:hypothetical protein